MTYTTLFDASRWFSIGLLSCVVSCATNPVTKKNELNFIGESKEIEMGANNYTPLQQISGGIYHVDPNLNRYISEIGMKLAMLSERPTLPYTFVIIDSSAINAWSLPGGKIAINRGLLEILDNEAELAAVLGHEITHAAARHNAKQFERIAVIGVGLTLADLLLDKNHPQHAMLLGGATLTSYLASLAYSRQDEFEADHYGMSYLSKAGYDPRAAITLQEKFVALAKNNNQNNDRLHMLLASHPPSEARAQKNKDYVTELPEATYLGAERYQEKTQRLRKDIPAYAAYEEGLIALQKPDYGQAQRLANKAVLIEPEEAQFYALKGKIAFQARQYDEAIKQLSKAVFYAEDYYAHYYARGLAYEQQGRWALANTDFKKSLTLLETTEAQEGMIRIAHHLKCNPPGACRITP